MAPLTRQTELARKRYDRIAPLYDTCESLMELHMRQWRRDLWHRVGSGRILELGVGTGKNMPYYPAAADIVALDISEKMLARARRRAERLGTRVDLQVGDVQRMPYPDQSFDVVVATFLFCSVPDPLLGLKEARRVLTPGGRLLLLEHVLSKYVILRRIMKWLDPIPFHLWGAHIDRETDATVRAAGFAGVVDTNLSLDVVKRIEAFAPG